MINETVSLKIFRYDPVTDQMPTYKTYEVPYNEGLLLLTAIKYVRDNMDDTLAFRDYCCGCSWCMSCTMMVDGEGMRTCSKVLHPGDKKATICDLCGGDPECVKACQAGKWNALWLTKWEKTASYKLYARKPEEATKDVALNAGGSEEVTFTTTKDVAGSYSVNINGLSASFTVKEKPTPPPPTTPVPTPTPAPATNWPLISGIIAGVVVVGLIIFLVAIRRRA